MNPYSLYRKLRHIAKVYLAKVGISLKYNRKLRYREGKLLLIKSVETEFADEIIEKLSSHKSILDVGCGDSAWLKSWMIRGRYIVPFDVSRCTNQSLPYVRADIRKAPFQDKSFDLITCICTIEHIGTVACPYPKGKDEDLKAMEEMKRVLKDNGYLILTTAIGKGYYDKQHTQRNYSEERINLLTKNWVVLRQEVYGNFGEGWNKNTWKPTTWKTILKIPDENIQGLGDWYGNICLLLKKASPQNQMV